MKGAILGYDAPSATGVIRGEDGERYHFERRQWRSPAQPTPGAQVDFVVNATAAEEIYVTQSGAAFDRLGDFGSTIANQVRGMAAPGGMNHTILIRIAKLVALFGFLLPWVAVSCSGQEIASLNGLSVAMGQMETPDGQTKSFGLQFLVIVALLATIGGAAASFFVADEKLRLRTTLATSVIAIVTAFIGVMVLKNAPRQEASQQRASSYEQQMPRGGSPGLDRLFADSERGFARADRELSTMTSAMIRIEERPGYFLTLLALAAAAGLSGMALSGRASPQSSRPYSPQPQSPPPPASQPYSPPARSAQPPPPQAAPQLNPPPARFAVDAPAPKDDVRDEPRWSDEATPVERPPRRGLPAAAWAAIALVVLGALGGAGYFGWRYWQAQQAEQAADAAWAALSRTDPAALRAFIAGAPAARRQEADDALKQLEAARYGEAQRSDSIETFRAFLVAFPGGQNGMAAQGRISELEQMAALTAPLVGAWSGILDVGGATQAQLNLSLAIEERSVRGRFEIVGACAGVLDAGDGSARRGSPWTFTVAMAAGQCDATVQITLAQLPDETLSVNYFDPARGEVVATGLLTRAGTATTP